MKVRLIKTKTFSEATVAALDTAIETFIATLGENEYLGLQFSATATTFSALLIYTG